MKRYLFFLLLGTISLSSIAQDKHIYITDQIVYSEFPNSYGPKELVVKKSNEYNINAEFIQDTYIGIYSSNENGIVTSSNASNSIVKSLKIYWTNIPNDFPQLLFYAKQTYYQEVQDLYSSDDAPLATLVYDPNSIENNVHVQTFTFDKPYKYFGFKPKNSAFFKCLEITWQLAHLRENLTCNTLGTICLPYDVEAGDLTDIVPYQLLGKKKTGDDTELVFGKVTRLSAGHPYVFVVKNSTVFLPFSNESSKVDQPSQTTSGLVGTFEDHPFANDKDFAEGKYYVITNEGIQPADRGSGVHANRAFIKMSDVPDYHGDAPSNQLLKVSFEGYTETGVPTNIATTNYPTGKGNFDITGKPQSLHAGIPALMLKNGKKVISNPFKK